MKPKISVVIVHWNTPEVLKKTLNTLCDSNNDIQIIVIDNASSEKLSFIKKDFKNVLLIENAVNRGFAFACNQGLLLARSDWVLFLNPDAVITPEKMFMMLDYATMHSLDACSPEFIDQNYRKPLPSWYTLLVEFSPLNKLIPLKIFRRKTLFGGCLLIKRRTIHELGGWDERFFLWFEDSDLTLRLINMGYHVGWAPVDIAHHGGASFKKMSIPLKKDIFFLSMQIFSRKHFSIFGNCIIHILSQRFSRKHLLPQLLQGVSIVIPNMRADLLESFMIKNIHYLSDLDEVIIVSSAITSSELLNWKAKYPNTRTIIINSNDGFASTVNIGFRVARSLWVGTVNDDVELSLGWLNTLRSCGTSNVGSINPIIRTTHKVIESCGITILNKGKALPVIEVQKVSESCTITDATNAACVLYRNEALQKVGLFDEKFGSYLEDIDLSLRLARKGYKNVVSTKVTVTHVGQSTSSIKLGSKKQFLDVKNWIFVIAKNWGIKKIIIHLPSILLERLRNISGMLKTI